MYTKKICVIILSSLVFGLMLQLVGFISPGWFIDNSVSGVKYRAYGLWFVVECTTAYGCDVKSYYDMRNDSVNHSFYKQIVGTEVCATLSVVFSILPFVLSIWSVLKPRKSFYAGLLSVLFIFISASFIWPIIGSYAVKNSSEKDINVDLPYALFLSAFGSVMMLCVGVAHIVLICQILSTREMPLLQASE